MYKIEVTNRFKQSLKKVKKLILFDIETHSNLF